MFTLDRKQNDKNKKEIWMTEVGYNGCRDRIWLT